MCRVIDLDLDRTWDQLGLEHIESIYWQDSADQYWFNDETEANVIGPYDTLELCKEKADEYGKWLLG